jgi:hypothetical protein
MAKKTPKKGGAGKKSKKKYAKPALIKHGVLSIIEGD